MKGGFSKGDIDNKAPAISSQGEPGVQDKGPLFIAVIGASAGGIEALKQFMAAWDELADEQKHLWILVIIQHLSPEHPSMMDRLLQRHSRIPISYAQEGGLAQAGNCYLIPSHADITLCNGRFALAPRPKRNQLHHPIDRFVLSLGDDFAQRSAVIICSGSGSDGTLGCEYIANKRGAVWVQSPREASFVQMPKSVLEHVPQARAASLNDIPRFLTNERALAAYDEKQGSTHSTGDSSESDLEKLIKQLQREHRLHWHHYHEATLMRQMDQGRLRRELDSLDEYTHLCTIDCDERSQLARDILVNVTEFFRDPECFAALGDLLRSQLKDHPKGEEYRAWIAGCATGEEAYSIAMLIDEVQEALGTEHEVRLWATDIHPDSVRFASRGVYRIEHLNGLNEERRNRYLSMEHLHGTIIPKIRNRIVFAPHNLLSDPPFLHLNLLSCRNVLIYLRDSSRNALLHRFSTALAPGSLLMLGRSEHINTGGL